jgi:hypothetical protein
VETELEQAVIIRNKMVSEKLARDFECESVGRQHHFYLPSYVSSLQVTFKDNGEHESE